MQFGERIGLFSYGIILLTAVTLRLSHFVGGCGVADSVKLAPAFRFASNAFARPLFILAEARLVPDVTRLRRVLATRALHSR